MQDVLEIELDDGDCLNAVEDCANDTLQYTAEHIFFFGKIVQDDYISDEIDERRYYTVCPICGHLQKLPHKPKNEDSVECEACNNDGVLYDFRNRKQHMRWMGRWGMAYAEHVAGGYVLRLFDVGLDYSQRDYDDYTTLTYYPEMRVREMYREYYVNGIVSLFENEQDEDVFGNPIFVPTDSVEDSEAYLLNVAAGDLGIGYGDDILCWTAAKNVAESWKQMLPHKAIAALEKRGFLRLLEEAPFREVGLPNSDSICEIIGFDYNKLVARWGDVSDISFSDLELIRALPDIGVECSPINLALARTFGMKNLRKRSKKTVRQLFKYIRNQSKGQRPEELARDYKDYYGECKRLGYDWKDSAVRYPADFRKAHERTSAALRYREKEKCNEGVHALYEKFHTRVEWSDGDLCVIMPQTTCMIVEEGAKQSNCVGGYCERVADGACVIAFVREAASPDSSYYTLELLPNFEKLQVVQCRGYRNQDKSPQDRERVNAFLEKYREWFESRKSNGPVLVGVAV